MLSDEPPPPGHGTPVAAVAAAAAAAAGDVGLRTRACNALWPALRALGRVPVLRDVGTDLSRVVYHEVFLSLQVRVVHVRVVLERRSIGCFFRGKSQEHGGNTFRAAFANKKCFLSLQIFCTLLCGCGLFFAALHIRSRVLAGARLYRFRLWLSGFTARGIPVFCGCCDLLRMRFWFRLGCTTRSFAGSAGAVACVPVSPLCICIEKELTTRKHSPRRRLWRLTLSLFRRGFIAADGTKT